MEKATKDTLIHLKGISKSFGDVVALNEVDFMLNKGEVHGLLGENGAGKSTLMNILYGLYQPDSGEIFINNQKVDIKSPKDSIRLGIGMVHQISTLVPDFNAIENIVLGLHDGKFSLSLDKEKNKIIDLSKEFGLSFPMDVKVKELPAGIKQKIEIIRSVYRGVSLLILDEPTTSLVESEFLQLLKSLQNLVKSGGFSVIFITHKIREVMTACCEVTVLRKGKVQGKLSSGEDMSKEQLVKLMFMEKDIKITESALPRLTLPYQKKSEKPVCSMKNISVKGTEKTKGLKNISLDVFGGEIFGFASVTGNGEKDLARSLTNPSSIKNGDLLLDGKSVRNYDTLSLFREGVFYTPADRIKEGVLPEGSITENILLGHHLEKRFLKYNLFIDWREARKAARQVIQDFNVTAPNEETEIIHLSGGNIQRVVIGRALLSPIKLLIMHNPTAGLDIASVEFIFKQMIIARSRGSAVVFINEDLDELMLVSDRIGVLYQGELQGVFTREDYDKYHIGMLMIGG